VPLLAAVFVALAAVTDPDVWWRISLLAAPVAAFAVWSRRDWYHRAWSTAVLAPLVIGAAIAALWGGRLETSLFLVALLALAAAAWEPRPVVAAVMLSGHQRPPRAAAVSGVGRRGPGVPRRWAGEGCAA
jgi:hypothetical protein